MLFSFSRLMALFYALDLLKDANSRRLPHELEALICSPGFSGSSVVVDLPGLPKLHFMCVNDTNGQYEKKLRLRQYRVIPYAYTDGPERLALLGLLAQTAIIAPHNLKGTTISETARVLLRSTIEEAVQFCKGH